MAYLNEVRVELDERLMQAFQAKRYPLERRSKLDWNVIVWAVWRRKNNGGEGGNIRANEIARTALFLGSNDSSFVNGEVI
ncbi:hypothetical protein [Paenibacillus polysaccharolyticus]|uniref:hypothetical protein n=1 Tax=Paenibacillus polysaccharolyticus TaxID=582692 RepID=UPI003B8A70B1